VPEPLYRRIADELERQIESGALAPGAKLLSELELRRRYRASRNTVRDALRWLTIRGRVETRPGQGTFVIQQPEPFITTLSADPDTGLGGGEGSAFRAEVRLRGRQPYTPEPRVEVSRATGIIAAELRIPDGTAIVVRQQRRFIDGAPSSIQTSYYPMALVTSGATRLLDAATIEPGAVSYLRAAIGLEQTRYRDTITVRTPDVAETEFFGLPEDGRVSVFETFRIAFDASDDPFRLTVSVFAADRNQLAVFVGQVPPAARQVKNLRPDLAGETANG
jgi:GntR family transcriptional regulator